MMTAPQKVVEEEKPKKKVPTKMEKANRIFKIASLESKIEMAKTGLDRYVSAIARSAFIENCTGGAYFNELFMKEVESGFEILRKSDKPDALKNELMSTVIGFGGEVPEDSVIYKLESDVKYYERLLGFAKSELKNLGEDKRKEIIMDCLEQKAAWSNQFDVTYKIREALKDGTGKKENKDN